MTLCVAQVVFHEVFAGMWVRNGLQIKGQAMTYIQCHFCNSMVDADLYLLQVKLNFYNNKYLASCSCPLRNLMLLGEINIS